MVDFKAWTPSAEGGNFVGQGVDTSSQAPHIDELTPSYGEYLGAQFGRVFHDNGLTSQTYRLAQIDAAQQDTQSPQLNADAAKAKVTAAGFPELDPGPSTQKAVDIMIDRAQRRAQRDEIVEAYKPSTFGNVVHQLATGFTDPLNIGMSVIPYFGQARLAGKIAQAATIVERTAWRAAAGGAAGAQFMAAATPLSAAANLTEGRDFTIADAMRDTLTGAAFGAGMHVLGGSVHDAFFGFPSKAPLPPGERPEIPGAPAPATVGPNPVMRPPELARLSAIERMTPDEFRAAAKRGEVPFGTHEPDGYTRLNAHAEKKPYIPFNDRELPQGIRQNAGFDDSAPSGILSDIDLGYANGIHPDDIAAHLVHEQAIDHDPIFREAYNTWRREAELRTEWDQHWTSKEGDMGPLLTAELSKIDFKRPQAPFLMRPDDAMIARTHGAMLRHSSAHALLMHQKVALAERTRTNAAPETPAEIHDRLPDGIKTQALAAALADVSSGKPVRAAEVVKVLAHADEHVRDSIDMLRLLKQDGPEFSNVEERTKWWLDRLNEAAPDTRAAKGITGVLKRAGGIRDTEGTIRLKTGNEVKAPAGALITQKGAARTKRGLEIADALKHLETEGYSLTEDELLNALKKEWAGDSWTLPTDLAMHQTEWEGRNAHNQEMLKAAGVARNARRQLQAERVAAYEAELARGEQAHVDMAISTLKQRYDDAVKPESGQTPKAKPVDMAKQVATDHAPAAVLDERTAEIEKQRDELDQRVKTLLDERDLAELNRQDAEDAKVLRDYEKVIDSALGCLYNGPKEDAGEAPKRGTSYPAEPQATREINPTADKTLAMRAAGPANPRNEIAETIRRRDRTVSQLEKTIENRDELRQRIAGVDAQYHEDILRHTLNQPQELVQLSHETPPAAPAQRAELYKTATTSNGYGALEPAISDAIHNPGTNLSADETRYYDKMHRYLYRLAPDKDPANSHVAAYLRMTDGKMNQPVDIHAFFKAYSARANEKIVDEKGQIASETVGPANAKATKQRFTQKDEHAFNRHLHLYGKREGESFGNSVPDEPAIWLINGDKVKMSPYIPGIEAAQGHPE